MYMFPFCPKYNRLAIFAICFCWILIDAPNNCPAAEGLHSVSLHILLGSAAKSNKCNQF
jgi:hypothetical protein